MDPNIIRVGMNLWWLVVGSVLPLAAGLIVAWPFWKKRVRDDMGAILGSVVVVIATLLLVGREYGDVMLREAHCVDLGKECEFTPDPMVRYGFYCGIGVVQMFILFVLGLRVERHLQRREALLPPLPDGDAD